jgi:4'-phosphopantetheinyl transferase
VLQVPLAEFEQIKNEIHVWHAALDREQSVLEQLVVTLSQEEKARADRCHFVRDRNRFVVARGLLRELLSKYLHQSPADLDFSYGQHGKPSLSLANSSKNLCFNLSHSSGLAVYAVSRERNLGIDVELVRSDFVTDDIAKRYFSIQELNILHSLSPETKSEGFYNCWTRKEAYLKVRGMGLQIPLDNFSVTVPTDRPAQFLRGVESCWHLASYHPVEGYVAAVAYDGFPCPIKYLSVDPYFG